jgi:hypothetical protein
VVSSIEYGCWEENFLGGEDAMVVETFTKWVPRDANNECPGWLSVKGERTSNHLINHPGIKYDSNGYTSNQHDGLSANSQTLAALCKIKDYQYVVGKAPTGNQGFRTLNSPGNNKWVFGSGNGLFSIKGADNGLGFNGSKGYVICSDTASAVSGNTGGGNTGGENNGGGRDANLSPTETR